MSENEFTELSQAELELYEKPYHTPGYVQSHGLLLVIKEPEFIIVQVSNNTLPLLGLAPHTLLNQSLDLLFEAPQLSYLKDFILQDNLEANPLYISTLKIKDQELLFDCVAHRLNGVLTLELEPAKAATPNSSLDFYQLVKTALAKLQSPLPISLQEFCQITAEQVRKITGYDRVMLYRFDEQGNGAVIAEARLETLEPLLGIHYPALDLPQSTRVLLLKKYLRIIMEVNSPPAEMVPLENPLTNLPLDMSYAVLRGVDPCQVEYLSNMKVGASMTVSLIKGAELWGLIACHHQSGRYVPYEVRTACELLGQVVSLLLSTKDENADFGYQLKLKETQAKLVEFMSREKIFTDGLIKYRPNLLDFVEAQGAALCIEGNCSLVGQTPEEAQVQLLVKWLAKNSDLPVFYTNCLSNKYKEAESFKNQASGLLAITISRARGDYIMWFRPEVVQTVHWSGNPNYLEGVKEPELRRQPRASFELWKQTVKRKSLAWKPCEIEAAFELRNSLIEIVLHQVDELAKLNQELVRSNNELDSFAYIASHDLKEPLRGLHNYSSFLIEGYADKLDEEGQAKLQTLMRLTQRMEDLIDSLLHFSRVGRVDFSVKTTDLNEVVHQLLDMLSARLEQDHVEIRLPRPLPVIKCDQVRVSEVFNNLVTNALKYNDKAEKWIEIGFQEPENPPNAGEQRAPVIFYIRDNGIGIREKHFDSIFRIFKRLHARDEFGGGIGIGLTIVRKIIERHGGKIWLESTYGKGTTFYFTLQD
ncbi:MAG: ATP-binding protein [Chloroflexota bacterium]